MLWKVNFNLEIKSSKSTALVPGQSKSDQQRGNWILSHATRSELEHGLALYSFN